MNKPPPGSPPQPKPEHSGIEISDGAILIKSPEIPSHELSHLGRTGLASLQQWLAAQERTVALQRELVSEARSAVIRYDVDTVDGLPQPVRDQLIERWRKLT